MKPNIFMSYSRREVGFVDQLTSRLEREGFKVWLDYRSLVPGKPWKEQINKGLDDSDVILLVISKDAITSKNVELEWRHVTREKDKRIILIIFEAVDLPEELETFEWVDFRGSFEKGLKELCSQLEKPIQESHPVPETGFKVPAVVWLAFALSLIIMGYSFSGLWALFVPWFLIPLPYRIFKRNFNFTEVQTALVLLPVVLYLGSMAAYDLDQSDFLYYAALNSLWFVIPLFFVLRSPAMQRWGKPEATMPKFANPYKPENPNPKPVSFFIDYVDHDHIIVEQMTRVFEKYGHPHATDIASAEIVLVLLSAFKTDTEADPEKQVTIPVLVQSVEPSAKLSKVQWIDFRSGVRNLDAMAQLLPEPSKLLSALGIRPLGKQLVLPSIITAMRYFIMLLGIFSAGAILNYLLDFFDTGYDLALTGDILLGFFLSILLLGALAFFMIRHLTARRGWFASFRNFNFGLAGLGILIFSQYYLDDLIYQSLDAAGQAEGTSPAVLYPLYVYMIGGAIMAAFFIFRGKDVRSWFPSKA